MNVNLSLAWTHVFSACNSINTVLIVVIIIIVIMIVRELLKGGALEGFCLQGSMEGTKVSSGANEAYKRLSNQK